jgi:hypothetical protein
MLLILLKYIKNKMSVYKNEKKLIFFYNFTYINLWLINPCMNYIYKYIICNK